MVNTSHLEYVPCHLCGLNDYTVIYPARYDLEVKSAVEHKFKSSGDELLIDQIVQCKNCSLRYVNPRLKSSLIIEGYSSGSDEAFISQAYGREKTFARQLRIISRFIKPGKVLDVGTAGGSFLSIAKKKGWDVQGIEPNEWLCKWGRDNYGVPITPGILKKGMYKKNTFDLVTLFDVLEHTPDPKSVLEECNRILKPGGILVLNVPDIDVWLHKIMGRKWFFYLSVHLYYFSRKTLKNMLRQNGFKPVYRSAHFQLLEIGYLLFRLGAYSKLLSRLGQSTVKILHIDKMLLPYWLGQSMFIARKQ